MTEHTLPEPAERGTLRFARFVVRQRAPIALLLAAATLFFAYPIANAVFLAFDRPLPGPVVRIDSRARDLFPDHPFIHAQDKFAGRFGNSSLIAVAMVVREGTIFNPESIAKLDRITKALDGWGFDSHTDERRALHEELESQGLTLYEVRDELDRRYPQYPVNHYQVRSLTHDSTRVVEMDPSGGIQADYLIDELPETQEDALALRRTVREKIPFVLGRLVSRDERAALVTAGFVSDRLNRREVYEAVFEHVQALVELEQDSDHDIYVTGQPVLVGWILAHAGEIGLSVLAALGVLFVLLFAYFRRWHGVIIPFIAAFVTVIWGTGFTGWMGIAFDPLILVIPMIITARAVSHTVQMAERFFEDYEVLAPLYGDPDRAKLEAAQRAMAELIVPGTLGILTDVAGLLVILVTTIPQMRNLGIFGAFWVASIVFTVELLHPILICYLPAPRASSHYVPRVLAGFTHALGVAATHPKGKWAIAGVTLSLFVGSIYVVFTRSQIGDSTPGTSLFWPDHPFNQAAAEISKRFGGADALVIYADGDRDNSSVDAEPLQRIEDLERFMLEHTDARATLSLVPLLRMANRGLRFGDPKFESLPDTDGRARGLVFQLRTNSPPGTMSPFMTADGRAATVMIFYPDHKGETIHTAIDAAERFIQENPMGQTSIRLDRNRAPEGSSWTSRERWTDVLYYALGPLLPTRAHTLSVLLREEDGYAPSPVQRVAETGLPNWIGEFRSAALNQYQTERDGVRRGERFNWPDGLADWSESDVDQWWESEEDGIRVAAVHSNALLVQDLRSTEPQPRYQPTSSWARGVQFVMAGGMLGILAAVNQEVERSHLANISLIFFVIFVLHSVTYRSVPSGAIILLQISTATLLSLAYMALRGVGLNINTLPVQAVGVGIGVDYAIYIVDRIRQEVARTGDVDVAIRRAIETTGLAVTFTATTVVGGIFFWTFSNLRFQAEMAQLLTVLMAINMLGAITVVPAFYSIVRPRVVTSLLRSES
jgi:predicted RND superfamily exporter protein